MQDDSDNIEPREMAEAASWPPIPDAELVKGATLTAVRLIELGAMSGDPRSAQWAFRLMRLRDEIQQNSARAGAPLSVRIFKGGLHINTDAEAVGYHNDRGENGLAMVRRQVGMLSQAIDPAMLSSSEQARLDRALCVWGARMAALRKAAKLSSGEAPQGAARRGEAGLGLESAPGG
jgi:hypothetical protein